jgi:hypothetical protein
MNTYGEQFKGTVTRDEREQNHPFVRGFKEKNKALNYVLSDISKEISDFFTKIHVI